MKRGWFPVQAATAIIDAGAVQLYNPNSAVSFRKKVPFKNSNF